MTDTDTSKELVRAYYGLLQAGPDRFDADRLRVLLAPELDFEGPIAGHRIGAAPFLAGVCGFVAVVRGITLLRLLADGLEVAALYDAELPGGAVRFAEFFEVEDGRIRSLRLLYDATEYRARGGG